MEDEARLERERREKERLAALKNKEKKEQSAVASSEVKQKLQVTPHRPRPALETFFFFVSMKLDQPPSFERALRTAST